MKITRYSMLEAELTGVIRTANPSLAGVVLERLDNGEVLPIFVGMLETDSYYAVIRFLDKGGVEYEIDSRPSDAIARALRFDCPIFAEEQVFIRYAQQRGEEE